MFKKIAEFFKDLFKPEPLYAPAPYKVEPQSEPLVQMGPETSMVTPQSVQKPPEPVPAPVKKKVTRTPKPKADKSSTEPSTKKPRAKKRAQ